MKKEDLEKNGYEVYSDDKKYFYAKDKDGYLYNFNKKSKNINLRKICKDNIFSIENIKKYITKNQIPIILKSKLFEGVQKNLIFEDKNGHVFTRTWKNIVRKGAIWLCPECTKNERGKKRRISGSQAKQEYLEKGFILLEPYERNNIPVLCKNREGYLGRLSRQNLSMGKILDVFSTLNEYTTYNIRLYLKKNNIPLELISTRYLGYETPLLWKCECGKIFKRTFEELNHRRVYRCSACTNRISGNELKVQNFLDKYDIVYFKEYKFKGCKYKKEMPFDFYLPVYNLCIEVQGEQHYKPIRFGGRDEKESVKAFLRQKERDKIKENFCIENNIDLLKISYLDMCSENYKKIISYKLNINM